MKGADMVSCIHGVSRVYRCTHTIMRSPNEKPQKEKKIIKTYSEVIMMLKKVSDPLQPFHISVAV